MNKVTLAALAVVALASLSAVPVSAQVLLDTPSGYPENPGSNKSSHYSCDSQLGDMKRVYPAEVAGVDKATRVWITELCTGFEGLRSEGNAAYLRPTIAQNDVLTDALGAKAYSADDVYAVRMMGDDTVNLYVHHFN